MKIHRNSILRSSISMAAILAITSTLAAASTFDEAQKEYAAAVRSAENADLTSAKKHWSDSLRLLQQAQEENPRDVRAHWGEVRLYEWAAQLASDPKAKETWTRRASVKREKIQRYEAQVKAARAAQVARNSQPAAAAPPARPQFNPLEDPTFQKYQQAFGTSSAAGQPKGLSSHDAKTSTQIKTSSIGTDQMAKKKAEQEAFEKEAPRLNDPALQLKAPDTMSDAMEAMSIMANLAIAVQTGRVNFNALRQSVENFGKGGSQTPDTLYPPPYPGLPPSPYPPGNYPPPGYPPGGYPPPGGSTGAAPQTGGQAGGGF